MPEFMHCVENALKVFLMGPAIEPGVPSPKSAHIMIMPLCRRLQTSEVSRP